MIEPLENIVYLKIDEVKVGGLDTSSRNSAVEVAVVESVGEGVKNLKKGDKIFVKAWGVDSISYNDKKYYFVNIDTGAVLCKINEE